MMTEHPIAIITGASRGIGAATAIELAQRGYHLTLIGLDEIALASVCQRVEAFNVKVQPLIGDLKDLSFVESIVEQTWQRWGRIDAVVNNAAWREIVSMREIKLQSWEDTLRVCLTMPAFLSRWAAKYMEPRGSGVIVNVSSIMAQQAGAISPAYTAAKGAINSLTYELASLYGPNGIRVVGIGLGAIDTQMSRNLSDASSPTNDPIRAFSEDMIMLQRWGTADEAARVIGWVISTSASYLTGTVLELDGGWLHQHFPQSLKRQQFPDASQINS